MWEGRIPVVESEHHIVFYEAAADNPDNQLPAAVGPDLDAWDEEHVRLPCSPSSLYPVKQADGEMKLQKRWSIVQEVLLSEMQTSEDLEKAIKSYNPRYRNKWDFSGLRFFIDEVLCEEERDHLFAVTLPRLARLALQLPQLVRRPLPLLRRSRPLSVSLSQLQVASLLANAFFCTFPRRNALQKRGARAPEYSTYPDINFSRLYSGRCGRPNAKTPGLSQRRIEKLKCLLHYFRRVLEKPPTGALTFTRRYIAETALPKWAEATQKLKDFACDSEGYIEDQEGMLQVDFANKFVGGGVMGEGCVQEEIRFLINPELIVTRLFTEALEKTECLVVTGCQRFSQFEGYSDSFRWKGNADDPSTSDQYGRRTTQVVALNAVCFRNEKSQYEAGFLLRDLNKAYVGFHFPSDPTTTEAAALPGVATGNWGCGAFNGNPRFKSLLQLMAASVAGRDLTYLTFGDAPLRDDLIKVYRYLRERDVTVGQLYRALVVYGRLHGNRSPRPCVLSFLHSHFAGDEYGSDTDMDREDWSQEMELEADSEGGALVRDNSSGAEGVAGSPSSPEAVKENNSQETLRNSQETVKDSQETVRDSQETVKDSQETVKDSQETVRDSQETVKDSQETVKDSQETVRDSQETVKDSQETVKDSQEE